jgi:hypothetical protein
VHLLPDQYLMLAELVADPSTGLEWQHFDPKASKQVTIHVLEGCTFWEAGISSCFAMQCMCVSLTTCGLSSLYPQQEQTRHAACHPNTGAGDCT